MKWETERGKKSPSDTCVRICNRYILFSTSVNSIARWNGSTFGLCWVSVYVCVCLSLFCVSTFRDAQRANAHTHAICLLWMYGNPTVHCIVFASTYSYIYVYLNGCSTCKRLSIYLESLIINSLFVHSIHWKCKVN